MRKMVLTVLIIAPFVMSGVAHAESCSLVLEKYGLGIAEWSGPCVDGEAVGEGTAHYQRGAYYAGETAGGKRHGQGTMTWKHGEVYVGEWRQNKMHGLGVYVESFTEAKDLQSSTVRPFPITLARGATYSGHWEGGLMHGDGTYLYPDGKCNRVTFDRGDITVHGEC